MSLFFFCLRTGYCLSDLDPTGLPAADGSLGRTTLACASLGLLSRTSTFPLWHRVRSPVPSNGPGHSRVRLGPVGTGTPTHQGSAVLRPTPRPNTFSWTLSRHGRVRSGSLRCYLPPTLHVTRPVCRIPVTLPEPSSTR